MENSPNNEALPYEDSDSVLLPTESKLDASFASKGLRCQWNPELVVEGSEVMPSEYGSTAFEDAIAIQEVIGITNFYLDSESKEYFYEE